MDSSVNFVADITVGRRLLGGLGGGQTGFGTLIVDAVEDRVHDFFLVAEFLAYGLMLCLVMFLIGGPEF